MNRSVSFLVGCLVSTMLLGTVTAHAQLIDQTFDGFPAGSPPGSPWFTWGTAGTTLVDDVVFRGAGGNSLAIERQLFDGSFFAAGRGFTPLVDVTEVVYYFMLSGPTTREGMSFFGRDSSDNTVAWWVAHGGYYGNAVGTFSDSQNWTHIMDVVNDTWYGVHLVIDPVAFTYDITVWEDENPTNTSTVTGLAFRNGSAADAVDELQIGDFHPGFVGEERYAYLDDLFLIGPVVFADDFESGNAFAWSNMDP
ncbi:MAG: hypothetical protein V2I67_16860 [Thermoanaerobaculales bacterium]|nr:hypothetical protein [Thermoanaerobaculales bacterium]